MRLLLVPLLAVAASARADRLIELPTANKLPFGVARLDFTAEPGEARRQFAYLGYGIGKSFEAQADFTRTSGESRATFGLEFVSQSPIAGILPGFAIGALDLSNAAGDGARPYAAVTFREIFDTSDGDAPADVTFGAMVRGRLLGFLALSIPFNTKLRGLVEFDGERIVSGFELRARRNLGARVVFRETSTQFGLSWTSPR